MAAAYEPTATEIAAYVVRMLDGLHEIASDHRELAMLAYLIDIARQEAEARAKGAAEAVTPVPPRGIEL